MNSISSVKAALASRGVTRQSASAFIGANRGKVAAGVASAGVLGLYGIRENYGDYGYSRVAEQIEQDQETVTLSGKKYDAAVRKRFKFFKKALVEHGDPVGTGHNRILMPKSLLSKSDIEDVLGFVSVDIAIPEAGQITQASYRHPDMNFHIHNHRGAWIMHEDSHAASTMLIKKYHMKHEEAARKKKNKKHSSHSHQHSSHTHGPDSHSHEELGEKSWFEPVRLFVKGLPHVITEGIPGAYYYVKGQILGTESMLARIEKETPEEYRHMLDEMAHIERGNEFSGFDDAHNSIEGLGHQGIAAAKRKVATSFGSGWQGLSKLRRVLLRKGIFGDGEGHNTVEGLRHGGMAAKCRHHHTEFGSGWQGMSPEQMIVGLFSDGEIAAHGEATVDQIKQLQVAMGAEDAKVVRNPTMQAGAT